MQPHSHFSPIHSNSNSNSNSNNSSNNNNSNNSNNSKSKSNKGNRRPYSSTLLQIRSPQKMSAPGASLSMEAR